MMEVYSLGADLESSHLYLLESLIIGINQTQGLENLQFTAIVSIDGLYRSLTCSD